MWIGSTLGSLALLAAIGATLAWLSTLDLPPGDVETLDLRNDLNRSVVLFDCEDERCVRGFDDVTLAPGSSADRIEDVYYPGPLALADPVTHRLLGCLVGLPHATQIGGAYPVDTTVMLGSAVPCSGPTPGSVVEFYDPSPE